MKITLRKVAFWLLWMGFVCYAFLLAPPNQPGTPELIQNLSTGNWQGINTLVVSLFNIMGVWPMIYACVLLADGRGQKLPAWLFTGLSFGVGAFAILPYLGLREPNRGFVGSKNITLKILDSRFTGFILTLVTVGLVAYGLRDGNWGDFIQQWRSDRFIHVMSLDFCLLCLIFPALLGDDMARRGMKNPLVFWAVSLIPLFGPLVYLCLRSSLVESSKAVEAETVAGTAP
ncbi:MAG TPA: DUF2834 domain-containing protein [Cyanobacteria bacterium UBA11372]|nr:DUF2834 domain-containing protein [Cyanobacteria bacterium UBA11372]